MPKKQKHILSLYYVLYVHVYKILPRNEEALWLTFLLHKEKEKKNTLVPGTIQRDVE